MGITSCPLAKELRYRGLLIGQQSAALQEIVTFTRPRTIFVSWRIVARVLAVTARPMLPP